MSKPRLTLFECRCLSKLDGYIRESNTRGPYLKDAFSDHFDGHFYPHEVSGLVRKRLLKTVPLDDAEGPGNGLMGDKVTYDLTPRAIAIFWPDRAASIS